MTSSTFSSLRLSSTGGRYEGSRQAEIAALIAACLAEQLKAAA